MKKLLTILFATGFVAVYSQEIVQVDGWKKVRNISIMFNQSSFSNWVAGGDNALAGNASINYSANLKKGKWTWDNKIVMAYGMADSKSKGTIKTDDRFEINSMVGKLAKNNWHYSFFTNFITQFSDGYNYTNDPNQESPISRPFAPAYLGFGPGMFWKKSDNFKINLSPASGKFTFVTDENLSNAGAFGVNAGETLRLELGFNAGVYHKAEIMKNITLENILNLYSNYFDQPKNIDLNHQLNMTMKINKYISTNLGLHTIYDDNMITETQFKEFFAIGFNYTF